MESTSFEDNETFKNSGWGSESSKSIEESWLSLPMSIGGTLGDLVTATPSEAISKVYFEEKLYTTWHHNRVVLMGDGEFSLFFFRYVSVLLFAFPRMFFKLQLLTSLFHHVISRTQGTKQTMSIHDLILLHTVKTLTTEILVCPCFPKDASKCWSRYNVFPLTETPCGGILFFCLGLTFDRR